MISHTVLVRGVRRNVVHSRLDSKTIWSWSGMEVQKDFQEFDLDDGELYEIRTSHLMIEWGRLAAVFSSRNIWGWRRLRRSTVWQGDIRYPALTIALGWFYATWKLRGDPEP